MTAETTYKICCDILNRYAAETNQDYNVLLKLMKHGPNPYSSVQSGLYELMHDAMEQMDKAVTPASQLAALKRIVKAVPDHKESMHGWWLDNEGRTCFCDGNRAVRLRDIKCDSIPQVEGWSDLAQAMKRSDGLHEITMPTLAEVKAYIAQRGRKGTKPMYIEAEEIWVDPVFLADMLQIFPDAVWMTSDRNYAPLWCENEHGDGVLMPHHAPKD